MGPDNKGGICCCNWIGVSGNSEFTALDDLPVNLGSASQDFKPSRGLPAANRFLQSCPS